jgi:hypothetical protein
MRYLNRVKSSPKIFDTYGALKKLPKVINHPFAQTGHPVYASLFE